MPAAAGIAAALTIVVLTSSLLPKEKGIPQVITESAGGKTGTNELTLGDTGKSTNPDSSISSDGNSRIMSGETDPSAAQSTEPSQGSGEVLYKEGTLEEVKKYMGNQFKQPEYIPAGYQQGFVQVPADLNRAGMDVIFITSGAPAVAACRDALKMLK
jgi:hypothetical protein